MVVKQETRALSESDRSPRAKFEIKIKESYIRFSIYSVIRVVKCNILKKCAMERIFSY